MDYLGIVAPYQRGVEVSATPGFSRFGPRTDCDRFDWLLSWARETDLKITVVSFRPSLSDVLRRCTSVTHTTRTAVTAPTAPYSNSRMSSTRCGHTRLPGTSLWYNVSHSSKA